MSHTKGREKFSARDFIFKKVDNDKDIAVYELFPLGEKVGTFQYHRGDEGSVQLTWDEGAEDYKRYEEDLKYEISKGVNVYPFPEQTWITNISPLRKEKDGYK